jgi:beta-glucosidase
VNEPINYLLAGDGIGNFPPGRVTLGQLATDFVPVVRDYIAAHAAMYKAIKANDTIDADGDGIAAEVGLSLSVADWEPSRANQPSHDPDDVAARDRLVYLFHYLFVDAIVHGAFDTDLDGLADEQHPEWAGTLDWLGLQYYFRAGVSADRPVLLGLALCSGGFDPGRACRPGSTYCVPRMGRGLDRWRQRAGRVRGRFPGLPLVVTGPASRPMSQAPRRNMVRCSSRSRVCDGGVDPRLLPLG